jgi:hypothetical protein
MLPLATGKVPEPWARVVLLLTAHAGVRSWVVEAMRRSNVGLLGVFCSSMGQIQWRGYMKRRKGVQFIKSSRLSRSSLFFTFRF